MRRLPFWLGIAAALALPGTAAASDPTGLFVLLFGLPAVVLSAIFATVAFWARAWRGCCCSCCSSLTSL